MPLTPDLPTPDQRIAERARARQTMLTKPPGSLGRLERLAVDIAAWQASEQPSVRPAAALLFAADHPVTRHGVSPYPAEVTAAMLNNFATGGAAAAVLARTLALPLTVIDVGVTRADTGTPEGSGAKIVRSELDAGPPGDLRLEDAMSPRLFEAAVDAGRNAVAQHAPQARAVLLGEMGIGNSTVAAAVFGALYGGDFVGAGTGATGEVLARKRAVVREATARLQGERRPLEILRRVGGRDLAALYGALCAALEQRAIVFVDGFIATAAASVLLELEPSARAGMLFAHRSSERGHSDVLKRLDAQPLLDLAMRLGEASGALTAFPIVEAACQLHCEMATFDSAAVPNRDESPSEASRINAIQ